MVFFGVDAITLMGFALYGDMRELKKIRKVHLGYRTKTLGTAALLLCVSFASEALTLGSVRGPVILGRALSVTIPVQVEQTDNAAASCFEAEVFHSDVRQPAARVRVAVESTGATSSVLVRVRSSMPVNEPIVSVTLRTLCGVKTERRYVLLADLPQGIDPTSPIQIDPGTALSASDSVAVSAPMTAKVAPSSTAQEASLAKPQRKNHDKVAATPKESRKSAAKKDGVAPKPVAATSGQSRLQLDSSELFSDRIALLDREQPDAASDDVPPEQQKTQDLQSTVASLQALTVKNEASLRELTARLRQSEAERFPAWWVYALVALFLAAVAVIVVLLRRQQRGYGNGHDGEWYSPSVVAADSSVAPLAKSSRPQPLAPAPAPVAPPSMKPRLDQAVTFSPASQWPDSKTHGVDVSEVEMGESRFGRYIETGEIHNSPNEASTVEPLDLILPESTTMAPGLIAELRQQAEFFVALGQTDQAVIVLEKLVHDSDVPDPNVLLDLLGLLHSLSKKIEFQRCRDTFNHAFNGVVPEFFRFRSEGQSLEAYPVTLANIVAHWSTPGALDCITGYLVRRTGQALGTSLDLAAFRELLLLQAISQQLNVDGGDRPAPSVEPPDANLQEPPVGGLMELDLDLSDAGEEADTAPDVVDDASDNVVTSPSGLHFSELSPSRSDNLIDFELPDIVKSSRPDGR